MLKVALTALAMAALAISPAIAKDLRVKVDSIKKNGLIPHKYTFCMPAAQNHAGPGTNISPPISWSKGPRGTQSYAVILHDDDSPKEQRDKMNKEGMVLTKAVPRQTFYHWVLVDIPANVTSLKEGSESNARVLKGKPATPAPVGKRGLNDFTKVTQANEAMKGNYYGYDGPCPPWNDENVHHYHFTVYALGVKSLGLGNDFDGPAAIAAMKGKVLAQGRFDANYTTNPATGAKVPK
jgi:Raf kinase inhibitor-like YbhB/YbcL family protein